MPKAELHLHIEGTLEPELMMTLARRNGVTLPHDTVEAIRDAYRFASLQDFLDLYYTGMSVLRQRQDFFDLAYAYFEKAASQNVTHAEIFFDPQGHTERGVSFDTVLSGLTDAQDKARRDFGMTSRLIMCFLRHLPEEQAFDTLRHACRCKQHIFAIGLDSTEQGHPPPSSPASSPKRGGRASSPSPTPARKARPPMSPRPSTSSRSSASITATGRWKTPRWWRASPATGSP